MEFVCREGFVICGGGGLSGQRRVEGRKMMQWQCIIIVKISIFLLCSEKFIVTDKLFR